MKKIAYFLSYAYSIEEGVSNGTIGRFKEELKYLSKYFIMDVYSRDNNSYLKTFAENLGLENVKFYGIAFSNVSFQHSKNVPRFIRRIFSVLMLIQYFLLPPSVKKRLDEIETIYVYHVSGGMRAILYKKFFKPAIKVVVRYNWSWGYFVKANRGYLEHKFFCFLEKFILINSDVILATTEKLQHQAKDIVKHRIPVDIVPNWVDCSNFKPMNINKNFDIISVGRLCEQKNHKLLLEAVDLYNKSQNIKPLKILIISRGELKNSLLDYAEKNNIDLTLIEKVENDTMPQYFNETALFVMSSRYEGHPKAMVEAMACGLPIIGTDVVGIKDVIENNENGILSKEDPVDLMNKIKLLMQDNSFRQKISNGARQYILKSCSLESVLNKVKEYLY